MEKVETEEFSISTGHLFEAVKVFAGAISYKRNPEELFSPQMSVWTSDPDEVMSPSDRLSTMLQYYTPSQVERRTVTYAGMSGEFSRIDDQLEDDETGESRPWHRLRVLLVASLVPCDGNRRRPGSTSGSGRIGHGPAVHRREIHR